MQVIKKDVPLEVFNKFKLEILVENKKDLMYLWLLFNLGTESLKKAYAGESYNLREVHDLGALDKGGIWQLLDNAIMEDGRSNQEEKGGWDGKEKQG